MSTVMDGCEAKFRTAVPEDRICPKCGAEVEVFTIKGKIREDTPCDCGYVFKADDLEALVVEKKEK